MFSWGKNSQGECGVGDLNARDNISQITYLRDKEHLCFDIGEAHSVIIGKKIFTK